MEKLVRHSGSCHRLNALKIGINVATGVTKMWLNTMLDSLSDSSC